MRNQDNKEKAKKKFVVSRTSPKSKKIQSPGDNNFGILSREESVISIYVGNLSYSQDEFSLKKLFSKYGKVIYVRLVRDTKTSKSKGFAFIQMPNLLDANRAIEKLNLSDLDGRTLKVSVAVENGTIVKTSKGIPLSGKTPVVEEEEEKKVVKIQRRKRVRGLKLLFANTKS